MATTTNYSWSTPDDTALVKDGAAAIRSLGTAIDTTVFTNAGAAVTKATVDAKGDLIAGTADNTIARLAVGANDTVLTADSSTATGLKWASASAGGMTLISTTSMTGTSVTLSSIPQTYNYLYILINNFFSNTANRKLVIKPNGTSSIANFAYVYYDTNGAAINGINGEDLITRQVSEATGALRNINQLSIYNYTDTVAGKPFTWVGTMPDNSLVFNYGGTFTTASAITSLVFTLNGAGNFDGGSIKLYGVK
jgi:hypothetical protein